jgi:hypothetical protein
MNYVTLRNGLACSLLCSLFTTMGCGGGADSASKNAAVDSRAIYSGIDNVCEMTVDQRYVYWSIDINGDDVKDIGGLWRATKDGSGEPVRLAKAREARMLTVIGSDIFYIDHDGPNGVYRVSADGVTETNTDELYADPYTILSDGKTLYGLTRTLLTSIVWNDSIVAYNSSADSWSVVVSDAGDIDTIVAAGDYFYMTVYGGGEGNSTLTRVKKSGGAIEQLGQLSAKYGELYSTGNRLLLRSWGTDSIPTKVEELNVDDGSVKKTVDTNGCDDPDDWRGHNDTFYCFDGPSFKTFAETTPSDQAIAADDDVLWDLGVDDEYVYWVGTESVGSNQMLKSVYIGRQSL